MIAGQRNLSLAFRVAFAVGGRGKDGASKRTAHEKGQTRKQDEHRSLPENEIPVKIVQRLNQNPGFEKGWEPLFGENL